MPAADELYLLSQKSDDICDNLIGQWKKYFDWLEEVVRTSKESRGELIIPKTPARKKKPKNEDIENLPPPPAPVEGGVRKSSRAAARVAQVKTKKTLEELNMNLNTKIRRPSTPPKIDKTNIKKSLSDNEDNNCDEEVAGVDKKSCDKPLDIDRKVSLKSNEIENMKSEEESEDTERKLFVVDESDESGIEIQELPLPSFHVKKVDEKFQKEKHDVVVSYHSPVPNKPTRVTRTKKRIAEEAEQGVTPIRSTRSKRIKINEENNDNINEFAKFEKVNYNEKANINIAHLAKNEISHSPSCKPVAKETTVINTANSFPQRITRSKIRPLTPKKSPPGTHKSSPHLLHTPKKRLNSPLNFESPREKVLQTKIHDVKIAKKPVEVHEVSVESVKVTSSPGKVVKHKWNENKYMSENSKVFKSKTSYQTPSPASSSAIKILGLKNNIYGSVGLQSAYSQKRKHLLSSSPQIIGTKVIGTPTEVNRTKNILMGSSFVTKVQPSKPTKEEIDDRKQEEMRKKREREEETRKKKDDLLRIKMEEQKRKNEDRMRRVQEARELREKKVNEAREVQERERKQRDDRIKEEKRKRLIEAKKNEEKKQLLKKQAEEEHRLKEERRMREEQKLKEEQRLIEELKAKEEFRKMEEKRKLEERKLMERREAERVAKEKLELERSEAAERIAREKKEMEQLRLKESQRLQSEKNMNETYTDTNPMNSTYTKPSKSDEIQSYEMTPVVVKKVKSKIQSTNDYDIADLRSDDSTDDETAPKKKIPTWAQGSQLRKHLFDQEHFPPVLDEIFPANVLLQMPDLIGIFPKRRSRFTKRTSSAVWNTPPYKLFAQK